jgi:hypothetical protein
MVNVQFKYGANNIPRISDAEIERHAMLYLQDYNADLLKTPQPLDVEDFAEGYLKLGLHYTNLSHNGFIWGRMVFNNTMIIVYDPEKNRAEEEPVRANTIVIDNGLLADDRNFVFRSTVMHECGHGVYHAEYYCIDYSELPLKKNEDMVHLPYTSCQAGDILGGDWIPSKKRKLKTDTDWLEHQAKYFSAASLMPQKTMRKLCKTPSLQSYCFDKHPEFENDALVAVVARTFQVSETSARIRLKQLKLGLVAPHESPLSFFASGRHNVPIDVQYY